MHRSQAKPILRKLGEMAVVSVLGKMPRKLRRSTGRRFANAAWRELNQLPPRDHRTSLTVIQWMANQYLDYLEMKAKEESDVTRVDAEASPGNDVGSPAS